MSSDVMKSDTIPVVPDSRGYFGKFGGRFVPEILIPALEELESAWREAESDPDFQKQYLNLLQEYVGRPTRLTFAERLTEHYGKARIYLKREDLCHTGAHKIRSEEHTSELQSRGHLVCRHLLEKKNISGA